MKEEVRRQFPLLKRRIDGKPIVYLDSAATALKPQAVIDAEQAYSTHFTANIHRGKHSLSEEASQAYEAARRRVARHLGSDPDSVVFVRNTTEAINVVAHGLPLTPDDLVLASHLEHHSNLVPWMQRTRVHLFAADPLRPMTPEQLDALLTQHRPRVLALGHCSNVTGLVQPVAQLTAVARQHGVLTVVDAAQSAAHLPLDVDTLGCDFLAFSGHKLLAPAGIGVLWGRRERLDALRPLLGGGGTVERVTAQGVTWKGLPYRLEAGTPNIGGALGLAAALDFLEALGWDSIQEHDATLARVLRQELSDLPHARILMPDSGPVALASIVPTSPKLAPDHVARILSDTHQIMTRSGFHCAHPLFDALGFDQGALRVSAYLYNTEDELRACGRALREVFTRLGGKASGA